MMKKYIFPLILISGMIFSCTPNNYNDNNNHELLGTIFSHAPGFYAEPFKLIIDKKDNNNKITYTLDGTEPDINSEEYINGINIINKTNEENKISNINNISSLDDVYFPSYKVDKCNYVRIKEFDELGNEKSSYNLLYFIGLDEDNYYKNMPIININTDESNLFDYEKGIYVLGKTYDNEIKQGYKETYPANYNNTGKQWERPVTFSYFNSEHEYVFSQEIGMRIHGGWTRAFNQKSFNLYARKEYSGKNYFDNKLFETEKTKTFMLRSGGYRDSSITKLRDSLTHYLSKPLDIATLDSYPVILFLNNEYWGIYNMQERYSTSYIEEHYNINKDNVIIIEKDEIDEGNEDDISLYNEMIQFFKENDLSNDLKYKEAKSLIDIDDFIKYLSTELIIGNIDWPGNNVRMWRSREIGNNLKEDGKWRFMIYDMDDSMDIHEKCTPSSDPFINSNHWINGPLDSNCTIGLLFTSLLTNEGFKNEFKKQFQSIINETFSKEKVNNYLDKMETLLKTPMSMHYKRFVTEDNYYLSGDYFIHEINKIKNFYNTRSASLLNNIDEHIFKS